MSLIKDIATGISGNIPYDLARRLGPSGINLILEIMWLSYHDLNKDGLISSVLDENEITQKWYTKIQSRWADDRALRIDCNLHPMNQYVDPTYARPKGAKPTIDFCFHSYDYSDSYFGAECKILIDNKIAKYNRYISTGVENFTSGRYSSKCSTSALIGYVMGQGLINIITEIKKRVDCSDATKEMARNNLWVEPHYNSSHLRKTDNCEININHLFFTFS